MIIKALILSVFLTGEHTIVAMPPEEMELRKRRSKARKDRRRGGRGLR